MGLATPTAIMVGTGRGAEAGILFRGGDALEAASRVSVVAFDKTGTLTAGRPEVVDVETAPGVDPAEVLDLAASVERASEHPLGQAVVARANRDELGFRPLDRFESLPGRGVTGRAAGREVVVGSARLLDERGIDRGSLADAAEALAGAGRTIAWVAIDGAAAGVLAIADPVKPEAEDAIRRLAAVGIESWLITGDADATARSVAARVGIPPHRVFSGVLPGDKAAAIERLRASDGGRVIAMVGDGVNDAPALATADVGIAIGTGADVAIEAAGVTLVGGDPRGVAGAIELARATMSVVRENLVWAFGYNILLIPVAMGVLAPLGVTLGPALAAGAMALSSVAVVTNSLRLRGFDARPDGIRRPTRGGGVGALRRGRYLVVIAAASLLVAGTVMAADRAIDSSATQLAVTAGDARFEPADVTVTASRFAVLTFTNEDSVFHDWSVEGLANVDVPARPGQTARLRFLVDEPGTYRIVCTVPGHAEAGMTGTLTVEP
jgi:Cu+-exporting ATPase